MNQNNTVVMGLLIGAVVPIIGFIIVDGVFSLLEMSGLMAEATSSGLDRRERTTTLLAICCNLIPFQHAKKRRWDKIMKGIMFPTFIYVGGWLFKYKDILF